MQSIDSVNLHLRPNVVYGEGGSPSLKLSPEQGKLLNLREGQIINSSLALRPEGNSLMLDGRSVLVPATFGSAGDLLSLKVALSGGFFILSKTIKGTSVSNSVGERVESESQRRFRRLLSSGGIHFNQRFFGQDFQGSLRRLEQVSRPVQMLESQIKPVAQVTGQYIKRSLNETGLFTEALLAKNNLPKSSSIKSAMIEIGKLLRALGKNTSIVAGAIDELEAFQLDTLAANNNRQAAINWLVPFSDAPPVHVRISGESTSEVSEDQERREWTVELEVRLGQASCCFLLIQKSHEASLSCWIPDHKLYDNFKDREQELKAQLRSFGVELTSYTVIMGNKAKRNNGLVAGESSGSLMDQSV
tara:strand:+ start:430 stop:1509 length:1080 start_codon:yes stop_codon:yes gene_type:complete